MRLFLLRLMVSAIHLLEANPGEIFWPWLFFNPAAIHLLESNPNKIDWHMLSKNPAAIYLLESNPNNMSIIYSCYLFLLSLIVIKINRASK